MKFERATSVIDDAGMLRRLLDYPFDVKNILLKRKALRARLSQEPSLADIRIALLGGSTTSEIRSIAELFLLRDGFRPVFFESEYGKYFEDVMVDDAALRAFRPQIAFIHTTQVNVLNAPQLFESEHVVDRLLREEVRRYQDFWSKLSSDLGCLIIQNNFDLPTVRSLGGLDSTEVFGRSNYLLRLNLEFARAARQDPKLIINDINQLSAQVGLDQWFSQEYWFSYKMAVSPQGTVHLAHALSKLVRTALGNTRKCLVLDLDETLWGGVIAEDGVNGLKIGRETPQGEAFTAFQEYCRELQRRGILLAVCSKNDAALALEGFTHPDSVLKPADFSSFKANWESKAHNIEEIAAELNIGLDSLVFVDDNPAERALVSAQLPAVAVPDVGTEVARFAEHLDREGYFEAIRLTSDDVQRVTAYAGNRARANQAAKFANYEEFLAWLDMRAEIDVFSPVYLERIAQLTNKTNQFNLTTRRYTLPEIQAMAASSDHVALYGRLADRFGDNGLVSVVAGELKDRELHVNLWLMSCRVLKRDLEYAMLDALVEAACARGADSLMGYYCRTTKNAMVDQLYGKLGFDLVSKAEDGSSSVWRLQLHDYTVRNKSIKVGGNG